jgi:hypothetical protein
MKRWLSNQPGAGVVSGPLAWAICTQANYSLARSFCQHQTPWLLLLGALALATLSLAGALVSIWSAPVAPSSQAGRPRQFLASVGVASGILFALIICLQGAAALALNGCER